MSTPNTRRSLAAALTLGFALLSGIVFAQGFPDEFAELVARARAILPEGKTRPIVARSATEILEGNKSVLTALQIVLSEDGSPSEMEGVLIEAASSYDAAVEYLSEIVVQFEDEHPLPEKMTEWLEANGYGSVKTDSDIVLSLLDTARESSLLVQAVLAGRSGALGALIRNTCKLDTLTATLSGVDFPAAEEFTRRGATRG